jgi:YhcH/YjgK/YiaL family protein
MIHGTMQQKQVLGHLAQTPAFQRAFNWIRAMPANPADGTTELDGPGFLVNVMRYETKPRNACNWESHRHTADLQFIFAGSELIDWTPEIPAGTSLRHDPEKDFEFWPASLKTSCTLEMTPGSFVIFLPGEVHRPAILAPAAPNVRKAVFKINARFLPAALA